MAQQLDMHRPAINEINGVHNEPKKLIIARNKAQSATKYYLPLTRLDAAMRGGCARQRQYLISLPVAPPLTIMGSGISTVEAGENGLARTFAWTAEEPSSAREIGLPISSAAATRSLIAGTGTSRAG
jgi:hypothetical protein